MVHGTMSDSTHKNDLPASVTTMPAESSASSTSGHWWWAVILSGTLLLPLIWLLARLIWLPFYFGLFFFLIAGLLVGTASFRLGLRSRPISTTHLILGTVLLALAGASAFVVLEYRNFAAGVAGNRGFPDARNAAVAAGESPNVIEREAEREFKHCLQSDYPPGGPVGYIQWAIASGRMDVKIRGFRERVIIEHRGFVWPIRTVAAAVLLGLGLWLSFESLRSPVPVSNIIAPGEEAEESDA